MCASSEENEGLAGKAESQADEEITASGDAIVIADAIGRLADGFLAVAAAITRLAESQTQEFDEPTERQPTEL